MASKKDWVAKLHDSKGLPKLEKLTGKMTKRWGTGTIVIPAPIEVDNKMRKVPTGKLITIIEIREKLAKKHKATICCPLTSGIFVNLAARAAEQEREEGKKRITPYWRTLRSGGELNEKYHGGEANQQKLLEKEGHEIIQKGKRRAVSSYERALVKV